jgi:hypothetical protein
MGLHAKTGTIGDVTVSSVDLNAEEITGVGAAAKTLADLVTAIAAQGTGQLAKEAGGNLATVTAAVATLKAATDLLAAAGGGGYVRQDSTATIAKEAGGNLATVAGAVATLKAATDLLAAAGGGGYVRQDSTATIAKETGGNLATVATAVASLKAATDIIGTAATLAKETGGNLAKIANGDYVVSGAKKLVLSGTTTLLQTAMGAAFAAGLLRLIFIPGTANSGKVKFTVTGAADANSAEVSTMSLPFTKAVADTIQIIGTENDTLTVLTCIARA